MVYSLALNTLHLLVLCGQRECLYLPAEVHILCDDAFVMRICIVLFANISLSHCTVFLLHFSKTVAHWTTNMASRTKGIAHTGHVTFSSVQDSSTKHYLFPKQSKLYFKNEQVVSIIVW